MRANLDSERKWVWIVAGAAVGVSVLALFAPVGGDAPAPTAPRAPSPIFDFSSFSAARPGSALDLLFVHHSSGGQLLAAEGPEISKRPSSCIYASHPNGGGLRSLLEQAGYRVHEASYGSVLGEHTDLFDWPPKLRTGLDALLRLDEQDDRYPDERRNRVVVFKSCFPNNLFAGEGAAPGDARGPDLTVWNARAALRALLPELARHPETLFVYVTAPPIAPRTPALPAWRALLRLARGHGTPAAELGASAALARELNDWAASPEGWLAGYAGKNVVVFDYYDVLTGGARATDLSAYPTGNGLDSHPSAAGNHEAAMRFVPFLNRAVRRAGLEP
jgi:hypothetical protein